MSNELKLKEDTSGHEQEQEHVIPFNIQQKASLYSLCLGCLELGGVSNKKIVKRTSKTLKREVLSELGQEEGSHLLKYNLDAVLNVCRMTHNVPIENTAKRRLKVTTVSGWERSILIGLDQLKSNG
jgi:hypothetical protein